MDYKKWLYNPFLLAGIIIVSGFLDNIGEELYVLTKSILTQTTPQEPLTIEQLFRYFAMAAAVILVSWGIYKSKTKRDEQNPELKLDQLIKEIKTFITKWNKGIIFLTSGYRRQILERTIWNQNPKKISRHAIKIKRKAANVRALNIKNSNHALATLDKTADRINALGYEVESTVLTLRQENEALQKDPEKFKNLVSDGDKICDDLKPVILELESLRSHVPMLGWLLARKINKKKKEPDAK